ncbi:hypothetical protein GCM10009087_41250 [Sphingomonas oligophenolica]
MPLIALMIGLSILLLADEHGDKITAQWDITAYQEHNWYQTRFGNAVVDWYAIEQKPLTGYGFAEKGRPIYWHSKSDQLGFGNGFTGTMVKFGVPLALLLYLFLLIRLWRTFGDWLLTVCIAVAVFIILFSQQLLTLAMFYVLFANLKPAGVKSIPAKVSAVRLKRRYSPENRPSLPTA